MYKYVISLILFSFIFTVSTFGETKQQRCHKELKGYYGSMKKSIRIGHNDRLTINTVLAGLAADPSEEDAQWCSKVIADLLEDNVDDFSKSENSHGLYWALPQLSMILASPEIITPVSVREPSRY